ncbi:MAG: 6-phospho-beta-glucosidase [Deltaproteobacteria bacterium]|nr:6-phospho-beta-glucosidase [Deltaproteobacteria bacterium]
MKIGIIGGGSTYTPELIEGLIGRAGAIGLAEVVLMDNDPERLAIVGEFAKRMVTHAAAPFRVVLTAKRAEALDGASFVLTQFRVGHQQARHQDELLGLRHSLIGQETTGIGGMAKALRTLPVIFDICDEMDRLAPGAWLLNFTNPSGLVTEGILNHTPVKRAIGLCNVPIDMKMTVAKFFGVDESEIDMEFVGLNHLGWIRRVAIKGEDITARVLEFLASDQGPANIPDVDYKPELIRALGAVPLYYNRYYYNTERVLAQLQAKPKTRAEEVIDIENKLLAKYADPKQVTKPPELDERGGAYYSKIAVQLIEAIANDTGDEMVVNTQNRGAIPDLPATSVVEITARIGKDGATPRHVAPLEPSVRALIQRAKAYEELTVEAAKTRSYDAALRAIFTNPLGPTADRAKPVLDDLLATNALDYR